MYPHDFNEGFGLLGLDLLLFLGYLVLELVQFLGHSVTV